MPSVCLSIYASLYPSTKAFKKARGRALWVGGLAKHDKGKSLRKQLLIIIYTYFSSSSSRREPPNEHA